MFWTCDDVDVDELLLVVVLPVVADDVLEADVVDVVEIGTLWPPIFTVVSGALPKLMVTDVADELTLTEWEALAVSVPE